jgi:hypothetical protein
MDINFIADPNLIPRPRPEIRVEDIQAVPIENGTRIRINLRITPFAPPDKPNIDIQVTNPHGDHAGSLAVIETMHNNLSLIFHLREDPPLPGTYQIRADLFYDEQNIQSSAEVTIHLPH